MNHDIEEDCSRLQVHPFELPRTLDETEWSKILGASGMGCKLLHWMQALAAPYFELGVIYSTRKGADERLSFEVNGDPFSIELDYDLELTATLSSAVRQVITGVNQALKRAQLDFRFILERQTSTGNRSCYRLILAPHALLAELGRRLNLVAGITPEDYEREMLAPGRALHLQDLDFSDPIEASSPR